MTKIGIYPMVADVLHTGHVLALEEAKHHCDKLIVCLHCVPEYKNPIQTIYERYITLEAIKHIDKIIPYANQKDMELLLVSLDWDIYFLGSDYKHKSFECSELITSMNKQVYFLKRKHDFSSTHLKERILQG